MSSHGRYTTPVSVDTWDIPLAGQTRFTWEYDDNRARLLSLYQKGKDKQWDATTRIDWDQPVDPDNVAGLPPEFNALLGSSVWEKLNQRERDQYHRHEGAWLFSQFLHGEQGALNVSAHIVQSVPELDAKYYAATQVMDEARHVELYSRFIDDKIGMYYPINPGLSKLLAESLEDGRWDFPYLGMQVLIEGLALAGFGLYRDIATTPLVKQLLAYVMQDEARHVAFGRLELKDYYAELTDKERADRQEFLIEGCYLMRDRFKGMEVIEQLGLPMRECSEFIDNSPVYRLYQSLLFSRIVPIVRDIGLWSDGIAAAYEDMGVLEHAKTDLVELMRRDEEIAEQYDQEQRAAELAERRRHIDDMVAAGEE